MSNPRTPRLGYCLNVFPGQTVRELSSTLSGPVARLKELFSPSTSLGIEMHIGEKLAGELTRNEACLDTFRDELRSKGLVVVGVNAFPIGDFHKQTVKTDVFCPTWLTKRRVDTTIAAGRILAALMGSDQTTASVSTSPGTYRGFGIDDFTRKEVARGMARVARSYAALEQETGKRIVLSVEPEPWGMLETVDEAVVFFDDLESVGGGILHDVGGFLASNRDPSCLLRRYIGVNVDLCHQSVMFEDFDSSYGRLRSAGIDVPKVHVSSALTIDHPKENREAMDLLAELGRDRYLHQVVGLTRDGEVVRVAADIPLIEQASEALLAKCIQIRAHVHLPLYLHRLKAAGTTSKETVRAIGRIVESDLSNVLVVETYTWQHVKKMLPELSRTAHVAEGMAGEMGWLKAVVKESLVG